MTYLPNRRLWLASLFIILFVNLVRADDVVEGPEVIVLGNESSGEIAPFLEILRDPNSEYSPFEIVLPEWTNRWQRVTTPTLNLGYVDDAYWVRMTLDTSGSIHKIWDLVISSVLLDYVDVYQVFSDTGPRLIYRSGLMRAFNNRTQDHRYYIVPLEVYNYTDEPSSFLLRVETKGTLFVPMELYPENSFWPTLQKVDIQNWMFFGIVLAMSLYNLFLYLTVRDKSYLYYVLFISSYAQLHLSLDGYIFQHFWPENLPYSSGPDTVFASLSVMFGLLFITYFLNLKDHLPNLHRGLVVLSLLQLVLIGLSLVYPLWSINRLTVPMIGFMLVFALAIGFYSSMNGTVTARYFLAAWMVFAIGNLFLIGSFIGLIKTSLDPLMVAKIAAFAETMLLSFALARRIRMLREEREKQQLKADAQSYFLAQISHEIRTPLNGVLGTVDLLDHTPLNDQQRSYVSIIQSSGKSLLSLVNDVLDYSKIEAGKMSVLEELVDIRELVSEQVELFRSQADLKQINLTLFVAPDVPKWLLSDAQRMRQILSNLISNSVKFTDRGGVRVELSVSHEEDALYLTVDVKDTGIGISANDLTTLFDAYRQAKPAKNRVVGGTGLGLAITKELLGLLGGRISVDSVLGKGSTFTALVPLKTATGPSPSLISSRPTSARALNILVAEDNLVNQKVVHGLLTNMGHSVVIVPQGDLALQERMNNNAHFDVVLMDCEMPVMDGYEATRQIRQYEADNKLPRIPIIALTAHALEEVRNRCLEAGMNDFLTKPINSSRLSRTLQLHLD